MFTALAEDFGDLRNKVTHFVALAPITYLGGSHNEFFELLAPLFPVIKKWLNDLEVYEIFGTGFESIKKGFCSTFSDLCNISDFMKLNPEDPLTDPITAQIVNFRFSTINPASVKMMAHLGELRTSNKFA